MKRVDFCSNVGTKKTCLVVKTVLTATIELDARKVKIESAKGEQQKGFSKDSPS